MRTKAVLLLATAIWMHVFAADATDVERIRLQSRDAVLEVTPHWAGACSPSAWWGIPA